METDADPLKDETFHPDEIPKGGIKFKFISCLQCTKICLLSAGNLSADDLIELALLEIKQAKEGIEAGRLEDEEIDKRLSQLKSVPAGKSLHNLLK